MYNISLIEGDYCSFVLYMYSPFLVDNTPTIEYNHCKFSDNGGHNILENDPNWNTTGHPTKWTNIVRFTKVSVVQTAKYLQPRVNITQHYVKNYSIGVIEERVTLSYYKGIYISLSYNLPYLSKILLIPNTIIW